MFDLNLKLVATGIGTFLAGFLTFHTVQIYNLRKKYKHIPGPPADGILGFYLGNLIELLYTVRYKKKLHNDLILEWANKYGKTIKFQVLNKFFVATIDLQANREIFIERNFPKDKDIYTQFGFPYGERLLGRGILTETDYGEWKHKRALYNPVFHKQVLASFMDEFNLKSTILLEKIRSLADGKTVVVMFDQFNCTALDVISAVAFGMNTDTLNNPENKLNQYVAESLKGFFKYVTNSVSKLNYFLPNEWFYKLKYKKIVAKLRSMGKDQISNRIQILKDGSYAPSDLLSITLKNYHSENLDMEDMIDDFITFFIAGQETTANTLAFCFLELARHPDIVKKLREEIDSVIGSKDEVQNEDIPKLHYVSCVVKETLRLWPPVSGPSRRVNVDDFVIDGIHIPNGALIMTSTYACGRYDEYFPDPLQFMPERFFKEDSQSEGGIKTYSYFPFSLGPRNCIGQNFAHLEAKVILTKLIKNFDFELVPGQDLSPVQYATNRPRDGTKCYIVPRKN